MPFKKPEHEHLYASIFWHAAGRSENEQRNPERFEYFGIINAAMMAGSVPVVVAKAGQFNIVDGLANGCHSQKYVQECIDIAAIFSRSKVCKELC